MARRSNDNLMYILIGVVVIGLVVVMMNSQSTIVVKNSGGVQFDSVRKHPFDVFADPYHPPERSNPYLFGRDYSYQQVGLLEGGSGMIPLFGRPSPNSSNRWEYYTMNSGLKLPVSIGKKTCNSDTGCPELLSGSKGESVDVLGLGNMKSFIYDTKQLRR
jgi:hypothetical protein